MALEPDPPASPSLKLGSKRMKLPHTTPCTPAGVLSEEELGHKLYVHELGNEYAARIHNLRSYDAVSRDIMQVRGGELVGRCRGLWCV